jgi:hypothetical protein
MTRGLGRNVLGCLRGRARDRGLVVIAAHYDAWFGGATDNAAGVASLLALADTLARGSRPRHSIIFAAFDGEELALYGAYDFLRRYLCRGRRRVIAVLNLETPAAREAGIAGWACSGHSFLEAALRAGGLGELYPSYLPLELVPQLFGGIIPTDVQPFFRYGSPAMSTAVDAPYYHTRCDTPERVDLPLLAEVTHALARAVVPLANLGALPSSAAGWRVAVARRDGEIVVEVAADRPQPGALVELTVLEQGFFPVAELEAHTDERGRAGFALAPRRAAGWLHVAAGMSYPLAETLLREL